MHGAPEIPPDERDNGPASAPLVPSIAGYEGLAFLARGGFGLVFTARDRATGRRVAVKVARGDRPEARRRLAAELRVLTDIGPPHVPAVLGHGETDAGSPYLVLDYLGDSPLAGALTDLVRPPPLDEAVATAIAVARALAAVHDRGWVHRDLKPENVFLDASGRATLIDFGLVLEAEEARDSAEDAPGERAAVGTIDYMSPEQCEGQPDIDARADIYAMGVILHELITGRAPFWGPRAVVREKHLGHRPPRLSAASPDAPIPEALEAVAARCLAKDRGDRFATAQGLLEALEAARALPVIEGAPAAPAAPAATARPAAEARKLTCGVVFFETTAPPTAVQARLRAAGGQIAHGAGGRYAAVFVPDLARNPAERARLAAEHLIKSAVCARARVDLATVTAQARKDGTVRLVSPALARPDRYPAEGDPQLVITPAAAEVLRGAGEAPSSAPRERPSRPAPAGSPPAGGAAPRAAGRRDTPAATWPLLGRDDLVAALIESARQTISGGGPAVVTVLGEAGVGKSHLFREVAARLAALEPGATVLALRAREPAPGDVDPTLTELVRCGVSGEAPGEETGQGEQRRSELLAAVLAQGGRDGAAVRSFGAAPGALRSALTTAAGEALRRRAASSPLLVLLDDAHAAEDVALEALEYATLAGAGARVWVCAIGRPALAQDHPGWGERAGRRERLSIGPLDAASAARLCRRLLLPAESVPGPAIEALVARAAATPLLLVELVRGLRREGIVRRSPKGESWYLATDELDRLPELPLVEWLAHGEIGGLSPALRDHARLIALLGDDVTGAEIAGVVRAIDDLGGGDQLPLDAGVATRRLLSTGMITRDGEGRLRYRQALVRQVLARDTPEALRRLVHRAAASYYRDAAAPPEHLRLARLGAHAGAAGLGEEAARAYFTLAERSRYWHAYLEAERLYSRALEQPGVPAAEQAAARRGRGLMRYRLSRYHDALADFAAARAFADEQGDTRTSADIQLDEATVLDWMDDFATSEQRVREAERRAPEDAPPLFKARLLLGVGRAAIRFNRNEEAADTLQRAASAAASLGDDGYETRVIALLLLGFILPPLNRPEDAHRVLEELVALCEAHGDMLHLGGALNTRGLLRGSVGDRERMTADLERSIAIARELGQPSLELNGEFNLGEYLLCMDDSAAAAPHIARARALDLRITGDPGRALVALLEARLLLHAGDAAGAAALARDVRSHQAAARARGEADRLMAPSEDVLCSAIELATGGGSPEEWDALEARSEQCSVGQERIEVIETRAVALHREGRAAEARAHLLRAIELASRLPNAMRGRLARRLAEMDRSPP